MSKGNELTDVSPKEAEAILNGVALTEEELYARHEGEHDGGRLRLHSWQEAIIRRTIKSLEDDEEALVSFMQMVSYVKSKAAVAY